MRKSFRGTNDLRYRSHTDFFSHLYGKPLDQDGLHDALDGHLISVVQALFDESTNVIGSASKLRNLSAREYAVTGLANRMTMLWESLREIRRFVPVKRTAPLTGEETARVARELNLFYINIIGALDNIALTMSYEAVPEAEHPNPRDIGLFSRFFRRRGEFQSARSQIDQHAAWLKEVKERRDPSSHRIPLYLPPAELTPEEFEQYNALHHEFLNSISAGKFGASDALVSRMRALGRRALFFAHSPTGPRYRLYPVLPEDAGHVVECCEMLREWIASRSVEPD